MITFYHKDADQHIMPTRGLLDINELIPSGDIKAATLKVTNDHCPSLCCFFTPPMS